MRLHLIRPAAVVAVLVGSSVSTAAAADRNGDVLGRGNDINARGERRTNIEAVEEARDRGAGRIVDQDTWTLDRMEAYRDRRYVPGRDFKLYDQDRDRALRLERRARDRGPDRRRAAGGGVDDERPPGDPPIVTGEPADRAGLSPLTPQLHEDEILLEDAAQELDSLLEGLDEAERRELQRSRQRLEREGRGEESDAAAERIGAEYAKWRADARAEHDRTRARVLGLRERSGAARPPVPPPATKPTTVPSR